MAKMLTIMDKSSYYGNLLMFLYAIGEKQAAIKMEQNVREEVPIVKKVVSERQINVDEKVENAENVLETASKNLNYWSQRVGFPPISDEGMKKIHKFCEDEKRREYLRGQILKYLRGRKVVSIRDLMLQRYAVEKKEAEKKKRKEEAED